MTDYEMTEDQLEAAQQLQRLHQELEDDENYNYGPMPDYSETTARLKEINEQWSSEPLPTDERVRMVEFSNEVQAQTYVGEDEESPPAEDEEGGLSTGLTHVDITDKTTAHTSRTHTGTHNSGHNATSNDQTSRPSPHNDTQSDHMIIERANKSHISHSPDNKIEHQKERKRASFAPDPVDSTEKNRNNNSTTDGSDDDENRKEKENEKRNEKNRAGDEKGEHVLIEINGSFEYVSVEELQARGYPIPDELIEKNPNLRDDSNDNNKVSRSRPMSSVTRSGDNTRARESKPRAQSAGSSGRTKYRLDDYAENYQSPYGLSNEQKQLKERRERIARERMQLWEERKKEEEKQKREDNESAFRYWLYKKEEDRRANNTDGGTDKDKEERRKENEEAFSSWLSSKQDQFKQERLLKNRLQKERDDAYFIRSREECDKAFKQWLKNKRKEQNFYGFSSKSAKSSRRKKMKVKSKTLSTTSSIRSHDHYS